MPLTEKGNTIKNALQKEYGEKKGEQILYAGKNKGTFTGIDSHSGNIPHPHKVDIIQRASRASSKIDDDCVKGYMDSVKKGDAVGMAKFSQQMARRRR